MKDYYKILGISSNASEETIRGKYRELARKFHPDVYKGSDAETIFKDINEAYGILSDSLRRADYDQQLEEGFMRSRGESPRDIKKEPSVPTTAAFFAAFARAFFVVFIAVLVGGAIEFAVWGLSKNQPLSLTSFYPPMIWAGIVGILLGADLNFNVESFLGTGYLGRTYTFLRTFLYALSFAYFGARIFSLFSGTGSWLITLGITLGLILGATFGSDGEGYFKLKDNEGRFNFFYTAMRALEVGFLGFLLATSFALVIQSLITAFPIFWTGYIGFSLGTIIGAIAPENIKAYSSYASAAVKNIIIVLIVAVAMIFGILFGYIFQPQIQDFIKIFIK